MVRHVAVSVPVTIHGQLVIIQSRKHRERYVLPKGGLEVTDDSIASACLREAYEEAGIIGTVENTIACDFPSPIGKNVVYHIFLVHVKKLADIWPESHERERVMVTVEQGLALTDWREEIHANSLSIRKAIEKWSLNMCR